MVSTMTNIGMKDTINEFVNTTSIHGIPHTNDRRPIWLKVTWALLTLGGFSVALWQIIMVGLAYKKYPVNVLLDIKHSKQISFPAVTICNSNQLRKSHVYASSSPAAQNLKAAILEHQQHYYNRSVEHNIMNSTCFAGSPTYDEITSCLWARLESDKTGISPATSVEVNDRLNDALKAMHISEKEPMGHTLEGMLLDCSFEKAFCSPRDFKRFYDVFEYGNCYTFNGIDDDATDSIRNTTKPGKEHGLHLELFLEDDEYIPELTPSLGIRVVIHDQHDVPFPTENGFFVSPGFDTSVALKKIEYERLGEPWYGCIAPCSEEFNVYQDIANCSYSISVCIHTWLQKHVMEICQCTSPYIPTAGLPGENTLASCDIHNETQEDCLEETEYKFNIGVLKSNCSPSCKETKFDSRISTSVWPTSGYEDILEEKYASHVTPKVINILENKTSSLRNHILKVDIFYQELNNERIYQEAAYTWLSLIGDLGGQLGLWIGISILSVIEIIEFLINVLVSLMGVIKRSKPGKLGSEKEMHDVTPVEKFKMEK
ncbi:unnamed protein product [Owenia fusiformis]|uniref:Uncharacterized protein n=1 Tax=Owenia fusiformis TaxID=6347 RepID=A0A8S4PSH5_OWEFU|nr:unnamed protein product [Owenia fusiformis]